MSNSITEAQKQPRVLVSGALPPPMGGVGMYYKNLLQSSLPQRVNFQFVMTSSQKRELSSTGLATLSNAVAAIQDCFRFTAAVLKQRPQVSHIATADGLSFLKHAVCVAVARLLGSRVLLHPHCSLKILYTDQPGWWKWFFRQTIRLTNGVIILSAEWNALREIIPGCEVFYLPNAILLESYKKIARERVGLKAGGAKTNILYVGYLGRDKGSLDLIDAAADLLSQDSSATFHLVGGELTTGELEQIRQKVQDCGLQEQLILHPPAYDEDKLKYFQAADLFVYPSHHEGMPLAVIEAMASGLPIVATGVGGLPDMVIEGENGILVEASKPHQLAEALLQLMRDDNLRFTMQQNSARIAAERYDMEQRVVQLVEIYHSTLQ